MPRSLPPAEASCIFLTARSAFVLVAGADRDQLKQRVVSLLFTRFGRRSEKSSSEQLGLFALALRIASGQGADAADGADAPAGSRRRAGSRGAFGGPAASSPVRCSAASTAGRR
ncbi:MAG: hypothetical protein GXP62_17680 [Oligoflexia bacterium]|nr:hypothetical protein [Oligoflexia bacterium]